MTMYFTLGAILAVLVFILERNTGSQDSLASALMTFFAWPLVGFSAALALVVLIIEEFT